MGAARILLSAEEFDNYPFEEDKRYELDEGELIEMTRPAYKHNRVLQKLLVKLGAYFRRNRIGRGARFREPIRAVPIHSTVPRRSRNPRGPAGGAAETPK